MTELEQLLEKLAKRVKALEEAAQPFVEAYEKHAERDMVISKRKACMCMDVSVRDFEALAEVTRGQV